MTTSHAPTASATTPLTADKRHLRLASQGEASHTEAGRFTIPLDLCAGTAEPSRLPLVLTADEVAALHEKLGALLDGKSAGGAQ